MFYVCTNVRTYVYMYVMYVFRKCGSHVTAPILTHEFFVGVSVYVSGSHKGLSPCDFDLRFNS